MYKKIRRKRFVVWATSLQKPGWAGPQANPCAGLRPCAYGWAKPKPFLKGVLDTSLFSLKHMAIFGSQERLCQTRP